MAEEESDEEKGGDHEYLKRLALTEGNVKIVYVVCDIKVMRCKHCKSYYKYTITSGRAHISQHLNWFKRYDEEDKKQWFRLVMVNFLNTRYWTVATKNTLINSLNNVIIF